MAAAQVSGETDQTPSAQILMASTIGPLDAGVVQVLEKEFQKKSGIRVRHVGAGTGSALAIARTGNVDLVLVHARDLEEKFVNEGYGAQRYDLMYNDFVIVGPAEDPAGIKGETSATAALKKIAAAKALFITRGDNSGTNVKEKELWALAEIKPEGDWYRKYERGAEGNSVTLLYTNQEKGYTVIDRASYITLKPQLQLQVLVEKDPALLNYITVIPVNPKVFPDIKYTEAMEFINWMCSKEGQLIIRDFGKDKYGEPLFFPNSAEGKALVE